MKSNTALERFFLLKNIVCQMVQNAETGRAGNDYGYKTAFQVAQLLGAKLLGKNSNEAILKGEKVVLKSARKKTSSIGVTPRMRERIKFIIVALENMDDSYDLYRIEIDWFESKMYKSQSKTANGTMLVSCKDIRTEGKKLASNILSFKRKC